MPQAKVGQTSTMLNDKALQGYFLLNRVKFELQAHTITYIISYNYSKKVGSSPYAKTSDKTIKPLCKKFSTFDVFLGRCVPRIYTDAHLLTHGKLLNRKTRYSKLGINNFICNLFWHENIESAKERCFDNKNSDQKCCRCDEQCRYYGDCCVDKYLYKSILPYQNI